jgi:hypothetical protein
VIDRSELNCDREGDGGKNDCPRSGHLHARV